MTSLLVVLITSSITQTIAFTIHPTSTRAYATNKSTSLNGSIYAPGSGDKQEDEFERDHLGRLRSKKAQPTGSAAPAPAAVEAGKVPIRFVNFETIGGAERLTYAEPGANILKVADEVGVKIPRQCRSGLCGSCTSDVKDPTWTDGDRLGYQTVRTCQAGAILPAGCEEMVIDCFRIGKSNDGVVADSADYTDKKPLQNFEDGWEDDFSPDYKTSGSGPGTIEVVKKTTPEFTVKHGEKSMIEIEKPHWTPRIDANIPPWETVW